jgi:hypothetical protein
MIQVTSGKFKVTVRGFAGGKFSNLLRFDSIGPSMVGLTPKGMVNNGIIEVKAGQAVDVVFGNGNRLQGVVDISVVKVTKQYADLILVVDGDIDGEWGFESPSRLISVEVLTGRVHDPDLPLMELQYEEYKAVRELITAFGISPDGEKYQTALRAVTQAAVAARKGIL